MHDMWWSRSSSRPMAPDPSFPSIDARVVPEVLLAHIEEGRATIDVRGMLLEHCCFTVGICLHLKVVNTPHTVWACCAPHAIKLAV